MGSGRQPGQLAPDARALQPLLVGIEDVGRLLGCRRTLVYQLIRSGRLPAVKVGALTKVSMRSVEKFVADAVQEAEVEREYNEHLYGRRRGASGR